MISDIAEAKTVYYDDECNLCNASIRFIRRFEKKNEFDFVPLRYSGFHEENTVIYSGNGLVFRKSDAVLHILKKLHWTISWMYIIILVPRFIRNGIYDFISRNRIRWFGKYQTQVSRHKYQDTSIKINTPQSGCFLDT